MVSVKEYAWPVPAWLVLGVSWMRRTGPPAGSRRSTTNLSSWLGWSVQCRVTEAPETCGGSRAAAVSAVLGSFAAPLAWAAKFSAGGLVTVKVPSPVENAIGRVVQGAPNKNGASGPGVNATSVRPSALKSPVITVVPRRSAAIEPNSPTGPLVTVKVPSPTENATGSEEDPPPMSARSVRPSWLKSPETVRAPGTCAHPAKSGAGVLLTVKVRSALANATGWVVHQGTFGPGVNVRSVRPSWLKSPVSTVTPGPADAQPPRSPTSLIFMTKLPSPWERSIRTDVSPARPTNARSVRPSPLKSPVTARTPGHCANPTKWLRAS